MAGKYKIVINEKQWNTLRRTRAYVAMRCIKHCLFEYKDLNNSHKQETTIKLMPEGTENGRVLFSYINDGFLINPGSRIAKTHTNIWQSLKMAETFIELGYEVDVIHYKNLNFLPKREYSFFIDVRHNLQRLAPLMNQDCIKIMHLDTANIIFHNAAEANRLLQLQKRRAVTLLPNRFERPNLGIEYADFATTGGNDFTINTFKYAGKKIFRLPSPCGISIDWREKNWEECRKNFLWFSSSGLVHKGLDLALEAFKGVTDLNLTVCAPFDKDRKFVQTFYSELYESHNIKTIGWVDIDSDQFRDITGHCGTMLHLSCSEGGAPSVKMCMHAGLIPAVSYETGVDVHDFGFILYDCSVEIVKYMIREISSLETNKFRDMAYRAWEYARRVHTRENFEKEYKNVISYIRQEVNNQTNIK